MAAATIATFVTALTLSGFNAIATDASAPRITASSTASGGASSEMAQLENYLAKAGGGESRQQTPMPKADAAAALPDVDTMIARLAARLEQAPDDVEGWRTLGWSYLNTSRARDAVTAYERAASLAPARTDIAEALQQARVTAGMNASGER